jgi:hypothetical protein
MNSLTKGPAAAREAHGLSVCTQIVKVYRIVRRSKGRGRRRLTGEEWRQVRSSRRGLLTLI